MAPKKPIKAKKKVKKAAASRGGALPRYVSCIPRVIVRFHDHVKLPYEDDVDRYFDVQRVGPWHKLKKKYPRIKFRRLITTLSTDELPANFPSYFSVHCPSRTDPRAVAKELASWPTVHLAYVEGQPGGPPAVTPGPNEAGKQGYLGPADDGIDAEYAWGILGGDGGGAAVGLRFVDIEEGWTIQPRFRYDHEDLPVNVELIHGANRAEFGHGTAVLGIVAALNNNVGCVGIVPKLQTTMVASVWPTKTSAHTDLPNAIGAAIKRLGFGDVFLLEFSLNGIAGYYPGETGSPEFNYYDKLPVEVDDQVFDMIKMATDRGIIVVEAAGNSGWDLDAFSPYYSTRWGEDSGAIMVGAASSTVPHAPMTVRNHPEFMVYNYGKRVNCYAWGENIHTSGDGLQGTGIAEYVTGFSGTSGASAIIAGAALALQGIAHACGLAPENPNSRFSPSEMRTILSNWQTGTLSANSIRDPDPQKWNGDRIGVMPDLRKILQPYLPLQPNP